MISTALKRGIASAEHVDASIASMVQLNRAACEAMLERPVHLFLHVKVSERWADDPAHYRAIGLDYEPKR